MQTMKIDISPDKQIKDLKKQFHACFPYLKIEFFDTAHSFSESSARAEMLGNDTLLSEAGLSQSGTAEFNAMSSVHAFEQLFSVQFGLHVQVFRRSGELFLETTATDDWTLGQQNAEGKASCAGSSADSGADMTDRDQVE